MERRFPQFIHIGPGRSGTTYIYEVLKAHPEIYMAKGTKETNFFSLHHERGLNWYGGFYPEESQSYVRGEISNRYFYTPGCAENIKKDLGEIKLITVLRNPYDRVISVYNSMRQRGEINYAWTLNEALIEEPEIIRQNLVGDHIEEFLKVFDPQSFYMDTYDRLKSDPADFIKSLYRFLNVDESFKPKILHKQVNQSQDIRFPFTRNIIRVGADGLRKIGMLQTLSLFKESSAINKLLFKDLKDFKEENYDVVLSNYSEVLDKQIHKLEFLTGYNLNHWKRTK